MGTFCLHSGPGFSVEVTVDDVTHRLIGATYNNARGATIPVDVSWPGGVRSFVIPVGIGSIAFPAVLRNLVLTQNPLNGTWTVAGLVVSVG